MKSLNNMYLIDTDILIAELFTKYFQDDLTKKFVSFYKKIPLMQRVLSDVVLTEFELYATRVIPTRYAMQVSEKKRLHDVVTTYLRYISNHCIHASPNQQILQHGISLYQQRTADHARTSLTDCFVLATASQYTYTIISMDKKITAYASELRIPSVILKD